MYSKGDVVKVWCYQCERIEFQEFVGYFNSYFDNYKLKKRWKCSKCGVINNF
ncbi:TPA: hypothetical protein ACSRFI_001365 [Clostridioides difficile]|uniref:hypothetical protein n=1 Tax=Clostridioides TaxID=1870884 RepID=UPI0009800EB6|nr:hypothetical protein [Clostridioides difficile]MCC0684403.1 hypothetical protein [Clostridioides sp. ZZV14-6345]SJQ96615.1 Uncharacterised protein [Clostridioides difficile]HBF2862470.1 hypothetical protein [Clostridioides difficile]HBY3335085.1 hypothetical protein [Clostridioides difficile]HBY3443763.1 hypothetical protein [Clostridioides difficile]